MVKMPHKVKHGTAHHTSAPRSIRTSELSRWTSAAFQVRFGHIAMLPTHIHDKNFNMSAWGLSTTLCDLLDQYSREEIAEAGRWLTIQQNAMVAMMLEEITFEAHMSRKQAPAIEDLFFSLDAELYLPRGLRMDVICVTNIVPDQESDDGLEKFVAVLDYSEVEQYIIERRGVGLTPHNFVQ
jgi:hypothetical protein